MNFDVSLIISIFSILISAFSLYYTKKKIVVLEKETEKKGKFGEAAKAILSAIKDIKEYSNLSWYNTPSPLTSISNDILRHIHDKRLKKINLHMKSTNLKCSVITDYEEKELGTDSGVAFMMDIGRSSSISPFVPRGILEFKCKPGIIREDAIDLIDILFGLLKLSSVWHSLKKYSDLIDHFDPKILDLIEERIEEVSFSFYNSLTSEHMITINSKMKSKEIFDLLLEEIIGFKAIKETMDFFSKEISRRLTDVQKELFIRS